MKRAIPPHPLTLASLPLPRFRLTSKGMFTALAVGTVLPAALAVGFRLPNQDPEGIARGNAFVATADNPAAVYYNPAGITQLEGHQVQAGVYLLNVNVSYDAPSGASARNETGVQPVPQIYYTYSPKTLPLSFGLGVYAPYGLALEWPNEAPFRTMAIEGKLTYLSINPVVAWKIHPRLSVALGPTFNVSDADFKQGLQSAIDLFEVKGDGFAVGFNAGLRWQPHEKWAFGVQYRFPTTVDYRGESHYTPMPGMTLSSDDSTAQIRFPQFIVAGISFRPTPDWNFEFNLDWTDWDNVNQIPIRNTPVGDLALVFDWKSSFMYEFGVTRQLGCGYFVSTGYFYSENSVPDRTFTPLVPDANLHLGSIGFGHRGKRWDWTLAYHFAVGDRHVTGGDARANGDYDTFNQAANISVRFKF